MDGQDCYLHHCVGKPDSAGLIWLLLHLMPGLMNDTAYANEAGNELTPYEVADKAVRSATNALTAYLGQFTLRFNPDYSIKSRFVQRHTMTGAFMRVLMTTNTGRYRLDSTQKPMHSTATSVVWDAADTRTTLKGQPARGMGIDTTKVTPFRA